MELNNYIKIVENAVTENNLKTLMKLVQEMNFSDAKIVGEGEKPIIEKNIRNVQECFLHSFSTSLTYWHWLNYLTSIFIQAQNEYYNSINSLPYSNELISISFLKYENTGHYNFHVDGGKHINRTLSMILLLNDNYDGGELIFKNQITKEETIMQKKAGNLIVWPSNFLFPHCVMPVTKGIRYSVVAWAL